MRHRNARSRLGRTTEHRLALMKSLTIALVREERIRTTHAKALQLRSYVEPLVTLARKGNLPSRRLAFSRVNDKATVHKLFTEIGPRVGDRPGGYLRIVKEGFRQGDGALMSVVEFVDPRPAVEGEGTAAKPMTVKRRMHERRKEMAKSR